MKFSLRDAALYDAQKSSQTHESFKTTKGLHLRCKPKYSFASNSAMCWVGKF